MLIVTANKDNDLCQLLNRWIDSIKFSQWQNILLSAIHASCSRYALQLPGKKVVLEIQTWQERVQFHLDCTAPHSFTVPSPVISWGTFRWSYFVSKITKCRCRQCFILRNRDFCFRTHSHLHRLVLPVHLHFGSDWRFEMWTTHTGTIQNPTRTSKKSD